MANYEKSRTYTPYKRFNSPNNHIGYEDKVNNFAEKTFCPQSVSTV